MESEIALEPVEVDPQLVAKLTSNYKSGAKWFYWIAGLSIVNSLIILFDGNVNFVVGLGMTQIVDGVALGMAKAAGGQAAPVIQGVALAINVGIATMFVLFGYLSTQRYGWVFVLGMIIYGFDGLIFLIGPSIFSLAFHVFALFCIFNGYSALKKLNAINA